MHSRTEDKSKIFYSNATLINKQLHTNMVVIMKKYFASSKKVRTFAPAFER